MSPTEFLPSFQNIDVLKHYEESVFDNDAKKIIMFNNFLT